MGGGTSQLSLLSPEAWAAEHAATRSTFDHPDALARLRLADRLVTAANDPSVRRDAAALEAFLARDTDATPASRLPAELGDAYARRLAAVRDALGEPELVSIATTTRGWSSGAAS